MNRCEDRTRVGRRAASHVKAKLTDNCAWNSLKSFEDGQEQELFLVTSGW